MFVEPASAVVSESFRVKLELRVAALCFSTYTGLKISLLDHNKRSAVLIDLFCGFNCLFKPHSTLQMKENSVKNIYKFVKQYFVYNALHVWAQKNYHLALYINLFGQKM
jgi:hypothetical protein